jgi:hypothetical protein
LPSQNSDLLVMRHATGIDAIADAFVALGKRLEVVVS